MTRFRKTLLAGVLLFTVLGSMLIFVPSPAFANPPCGSTILVSTTMTASIGPCPAGLKIGANGIVLNCAGFTINGVAGAAVGIDLAGRTGVTVEQCNVSNFVNGFELTGGSNNILFHNTGLCNTAFDFYLSDTSLNTLAYNTASCPAAPIANAGFYLTAASNNVFISNTADGIKGYGFYLVSSLTNRLLANTANSNGIDGFYLTPASKNNGLISNTANNNHQYGYKDVSVGAGTKGTGNTYNSDICGPTAATHDTLGGAIPPNVGVPPFLCTPQSP